MTSAPFGIRIRSKEQAVTIRKALFTMLEQKERTDEDLAAQMLIIRVLWIVHNGIETSRWPDKEKI